MRKNRDEGKVMKWPVITEMDVFCYILPIVLQQMSFSTVSVETQNSELNIFK